jgi:hypothetical protein
MFDVWENIGFKAFRCTPTPMMANPAPEFQLKSEVSYDLRIYTALFDSHSYFTYSCPSNNNSINNNNNSNDSR